MSRPIIWLLDLTGSTTWRIATEPVSVGGVRYAGGLDVDDVVDEITMADPSGLSVVLTMDTSGLQGFSAESIASGATAVLSRYDDASGDATVVLSGDVSNLTYGGAGEPVSATVTEAGWLDAGRLPSATSVVSLDTWPSISDETMLGEYYPIIFGEPGDASSSVAGSPLLPTHDALAGTWYAVIAGHPVKATSVDLLNKTQGTTTTLSVVDTTDSLGQVVPAVNLFPWAGYTNGDQVWVSWSGTGGGVMESGRALTGAGDIIGWLLSRSTLRIDRGRQRAAETALNAYRFDGYLQPEPGERVSPWDWIVGHVVGVLPVFARVGDGGVYLACFNPHARAEDCNVRLVEGFGCGRISPVSVVGADGVVNDLRVSYAPSADVDKGTAEVWVSGDPAASGAVRHQAASASFLRYGSRPGSMALHMVYDRATAVRIALAQIAMRALPWREVAYEVDYDTSVLEPGVPVSVTDAGIGWSSVVAHVWTKRQTASGAEIVLRVWPQGGVIL